VNVPVAGRRRRSAPIGVLVGAAVVPAVALTGVWQYADANVPAPTTTTTTTTVPTELADELATDLLSYRRHPTPLADAAASAEAAAALDSVERGLLDAVGEGSCVSVLDAGEVVLAESADAAVIPASNQKLLVAAVAIDALGLDHTFRTELRSARPEGGVIAGNLYVIGGGDPVLRTADVPDPLRHPAFNTTALEPLADQVVALGVTRIEGDVVGDGSRYDDEFRVPDWGENIGLPDVSPYDALMVNDGFVNGNYGAVPERSASRVFHDLLIARGVTIGGSPAAGVTPDDGSLTALALIESLPLEDVLVEMLHTSDNNTAELLLKEIGFVVNGAGTRQAGLDAVRSTLDRWGMPTATLVLSDGSGLSRVNRVSCELLAEVLSTSPVADALVDLLPAAGRDGTLADDLLGTPAEGAMQAKTGTLTDVKALSGVQPGADRRPLGFSLVLNGPGVDDPAVHVPAWEALVELLDAYPVVVEPDVARFAPR
jgi:D-alanyl-D-alanine carboxypeptidase/D-alanyl-D-alanine-endopeptidase (penicillin-binding protein 4)